MSSPDDRPPAWVRPRWVREVLGVIVSGVVATLAFLIVAQEGHKQGLFDLDTNVGVGLLVGATGEDVTRRGFLTILVLGVALAVVQRFLGPLVGPRQAVRMLPMAAIVFLAWGLAFGPLLESRHPEVAAGIFGRQAGGWAVPVIALAALVFGLVVERVSAFVRDPGWWVTKHFDLRENLDEIFVAGSEGRPDSLELPEERTQDRRE